MRILALLVLASTADAMAATGTITKLSNGSLSDQQNQPAISGTNVVWTEASTPATGGATNFDIFYYDLNNPSSGLNLTNTPLDQEFLEDIDGTNVVWTHTSAGIPGDIVVYDLSTNRESTVASSSSAVHFQEPSIRGQWITFLRIATQTDVYLYDNFNGTPIGLVTNDTDNQGHPRVGGGLVVFENFTNGATTPDVVGYNIANASLFPIAANGVSPDVDGNTVVWVGGDQLFAYDITQKNIRQLTSSTSTKVLPRISGNRVVWSDDRNGNLDLYYYDLGANQELPLVTGPGDQFLSDIDGDRVVYTDNASGFEQVYLYTFPDPPPPPTLPVGCDPAKTNAVGSSLSMQRSGYRPVYKDGWFKPVAGKTYYVCVENGLADGSQRTTQLAFEAEHELILNPSDFHPVADPPHFVAAVIPTGGNSCHHGDDHGHGHGDDDDDHHDDHHHNCFCNGGDDVEWGAALFGRKPPNHVSITIRVSK